VSRAGLGDFTGGLDHLPLVVVEIEGVEVVEILAGVT